MSRLDHLQRVCAAALVLSLTACGDAGTGAAASGSATVAQSTKKSASPPSASASGPKVAADPAPPSTGTAAPVAEELAGLTPADYEEEAERSITIGNLDAELAKIEQEIHAK